MMSFMRIAGLVGLLFLMAVAVVVGIRDSGTDAQDATYRVYAEFHDVGGLRPGSRVALSGVTVGRVVDVSLDPVNYRATAAMDIRAEVDSIAVDSMAVIRTAGLVGDRYVDISLGGDPDFMVEGDYFYETQSALHLEQFIGQIMATWR